MCRISIFADIRSMGHKLACYGSLCYRFLFKSVLGNCDIGELSWFLSKIPIRMLEALIIKKIFGANYRQIEQNIHNTISIKYVLDMHLIFAWIVKY